MPKAKSLFADVEIEITCEGQRHLGAAIGTDEFKKQYVKSKVDKWIKDVEKISLFAEDEPQAALSAYSKGVSCRWQYLQRTVPNISELFRPLESAIRNKLIPALIGRQISDTERRIFALPYRYGGLAIRNPVIMSEEEYGASKTITAELTKSIVNQQIEISSINEVPSMRLLYSLQKKSFVKTKS